MTPEERADDFPISPLTPEQLEAVTLEDAAQCLDVRAKEHTVSGFEGMAEHVRECAALVRGAQAEVDRLRAEIERLRQALADIAAFEDRYTASQEMRIARAALEQKP